MEKGGRSLHVLFHSPFIQPLIPFMFHFGFTSFTFLFEKARTVSAVNEICAADVEAKCLTSQLHPAYKVRNSNS